MNEQIFLFILILINEEIKSGIVKEINENFLESKYSNSEYINGYKIPNSIMSFKSNGGSVNIHDLSNAFDEDFNTNWESSTYQQDGFMNDVQVTFTKTVIIDRILYQAPSMFGVIGKGYPIELKVYIKLRNYDGT